MQHSNFPMCILYMANNIEDNVYAPHTILIDQSQRSRSRSQWPHNSTLQPKTLNASKHEICGDMLELSAEIKVTVTPKNGTQHFAP